MHITGKGNRGSQHIPAKSKTNLLQRNSLTHRKILWRFYLPKVHRKRTSDWICQHSITSKIPQRRVKLLANSSHNRKEVRPSKTSINQKKLAIPPGRGYNPTEISGHFMSQQLDSITSFNQQDAFLGRFKDGSRASLYTGNLTGRKTASGRYFSGLVRWSWQKIMGQGNVSLRIAIFYRPVPPDQGNVPGSVYSQHLNLFNSISRVIFFLQRPLRPLSTLVSPRERNRCDVTPTNKWCALTACHSLVCTWRALIARHSLVCTDRSLIARHSLARHHTH